MNRHQDTILALIAGYVDTVGFVALFGLFTAHVTGNFVLIGAEAAGVGQGVLLKLLAFPSFIVGIALSSVMVKFLERNHSDRTEAALYLLQASLLVLFLITGTLATPVVDPAVPMVLLCGVLGTMAMGVQNAHSKLRQMTGLPNTVMTGNVTQVVLDLVELIHRGSASGHGQQVRERLKATLAAMAGFAGGAIAGAFAYVTFSFASIALPVAVLLGLAWIRRSGAASRQSVI
ncbi:YoaK family protein [Paraburkholderia sp. BCC1884]|uniref:YoaK family protein n=1 Tax=Paraburkholderia sp. BCC1884 TaxID=2562668 RepID=UPI0021B4916A|nr:YoaK family protein [Paraburkholderia sp. BCC1884]